MYCIPIFSHIEIISLRFWWPVVPDHDTKYDLIRRFGHTFTTKSNLDLVLCQHALPVLLYVVLLDYFVFFFAQRLSSFFLVSDNLLFILFCIPMLSRVWVCQIVSLVSWSSFHMNSTNVSTSHILHICFVLYRAGAARPLPRSSGLEWCYNF